MWVMMWASGASRRGWAERRRGRRGGRGGSLARSGGMRRGRGARRGRRRCGSSMSISGGGSISMQGVTGPRRVRKRAKTEANEPRAWERGTGEWQQRARAVAGGDEEVAGMRFRRDSPKMVQRQLGHDHMEIAIGQCGRRVAEKGQAQHASAPREWHRDRIWGACVGACLRRVYRG